MSTVQPQFTGSVPEYYDRHLVPVLFQPYADSMAETIAGLSPTSVLELACGTGVVTQALASGLAGEARIVATDVSQSMLNFAMKKLAGLESIKCQVADACSLPFEDHSFDAVACQFGAMFFPDKLVAMKEAFRVLSPGGNLVFSTWGNPSENPVFYTVEKTVSAMLPEEETPIMPTPFLMSDSGQIRDLVLGAGFVFVEVVEETHAVGPYDPASLAAGFAYGTPLGIYLGSRGYDLEKVCSGLATGYAKELGDPVRCSMQALVCHAKKG